MSIDPDHLDKIDSFSRDKLFEQIQNAKGQVDGFTYALVLVSNLSDTARLEIEEQKDYVKEIIKYMQNRYKQLDSI